MKSIPFQPLTDPPSENDLSLYPDFLVTCLLKNGIGSIEADKALQHDGTVDFILTSKTASTACIVSTIGTGYFRPVLARFGYRCRDDMLYCGHDLFTCQFEREGKIREHRFSLFLCNEPTMACWLRLYLYAIDDLFPAF
jgi:hypothetical protein